MALIAKIFRWVATVNSRVLTGAHPTGQDSPAPTGDVTAPTVPANPVASNITATAFTLSCDDATDAVGVAGYQWEVGGVAQTASLNKLQTFTSRAPSTNYTARVRAYDAAGNYSAYSSYVSGGVTTLAQSVLTWDDPLDTFLEVTVGTPFTADLSTVCDSTLGPGTISFTVTSGAWPTGLAMNSAGLISGTPVLVETNAVEVTASDGISTEARVFTVESLNEDVTAPDAPTSFAAGTALGPTIGPTLSWVNVADTVVANARTSGFLGVDIYRDGVKIDRAADGATSYIPGQTNPAIVLVAGTTYAWKARSVDNAFNKGPFTATISVAQPTTGTPGIVTSFTVTAVSSSQIDVAWSAPASGATVTTYLLEELNGTTWSTVSTWPKLSPTTFSRTGLSAGDTRGYRVTAYASATPGPTSTPLSATTASSGTVTLVHSDDMEAATFSIGKTSDANYNSKNWTLSDDFDYALDSAPSTTTSQARYGSRSVYCKLTNTGRVTAYNPTVHTIAANEYAHRNQFNAKTLSVANGGSGLVTSLVVGGDYWIGWSWKLPTGFEVAVNAAGYEILYQMHSYDADPGESNTRNPPVTIQSYTPAGSSTRSNLMFQYRCYSGQFGPSSKTTPPTYTDRTVTVDLGSYASDIGHWTDWVLHIKPDYNVVGAGITELWKNGVKLVSDIGGGNCYNDSYALSGPNFGFYLGTVAAAAAAVAPARREMYLDEYKMIRYYGGTQTAADTSHPGYIAVAPRGVRT